jgi:hypothetical protein
VCTPFPDKTGSNLQISLSYYHYTLFYHPFHASFPFALDVVASLKVKIHNSKDSNHDLIFSDTKREKGLQLIEIEIESVLIGFCQGSFSKSKSSCCGEFSSF